MENFPCISNIRAKHMKTIILALLLIPVIAFAAEPCSNVKEKRIVEGTAPTASALYENLKNIESGAWKDGFWSETFSYIGDIHTTNGKAYKIGFLKTIWGESCRATNRLFVFGADNLCIGQYSGISEPPLKISRTVLIFPFDDQDGNEINFENGPPSPILLDGETPEWMPAKKL